MKLGFQWLSKNNIDTIENYYKKIFRSNKWYQEELDNFRLCLDGKLDDLYDTIGSALIKLNGEDIGITGFYSSFLFKNDMWIGWTGFLDKDIEERFSESIIKCLESYIKNKFNNINHIRIYLKCNSIGTIELYEDMGFTKEDKIFKRKGVPIVVMSKCIKGKFKHWDKKPVW